MPAPLLVAGAVMGGAGLAGQIAASRRRVRPPNYDALLAQLRASEQEQINTAKSYRGQLQPMTDQFAAKIAEAKKLRQGESKALGEKYLNDVSGATDDRLKMQSDQLKQRVLEVQPELQQQLREGLASTGNLQGGAGGAAFGKLATEAGRVIGEGQTELSIENARAKERAFETVYNADNAMVQELLGIDRDTAMAVLKSGREDLINEMNAILEAQQGRQAGVAGIMGQEAEFDFASRIAKARAQQDVFASMTGLGGTLAGIGHGEMIASRDAAESERRLKMILDALQSGQV